MRIALDLDGVICQLRKSKQHYSELEPVLGAVEKIRALRAEGHYIIISTARHMNTCNGNASRVVARQGLITLDWLKRHNSEYDEFHFGKPYAHLYIDDNALRFASWDQINVSILPHSTEERLAAVSERSATKTRQTTVIMPMAGRGTRFRNSRFVDKKGDPPKPLIHVAGQPMIWWALQSLKGIAVAKIIFVVLEEHEEKFGITEQLQQLGSSCLTDEVPIEVVIQKDFVEGQLCSVLEARDYIPVDTGILIMSVDTLVDSDLGWHIHTHDDACAGLISVADLPGDHWSFARVDSTGQVIDVAEKKRISNHASTGMYYFAQGREFLAAAEEMIASQEKTHGEYYVMPVYKHFVQRQQRVELSMARTIWELGTPDSLEKFITHLRATFLYSFEI